MVPFQNSFFVTVLVDDTVPFTRASVDTEALFFFYASVYCGTRYSEKRYVAKILYIIDPHNSETGV